jgi:hypothetical protein
MSILRYSSSYIVYVSILFISCFLTIYHFLTIQNTVYFKMSPSVVSKLFWPLLIWCSSSATVHTPALIAQELNKYSNVILLCCRRLFFLFQRHVEMDKQHDCCHYFAVWVLATGFSWHKVYEEILCSFSWFWMHLEAAIWTNTCVVMTLASLGDGLLYNYCMTIHLWMNWFEVEWKRILEWLSNP